MTNLDERAVEAKQLSQAASNNIIDFDSIGSFEPNQLSKLTKDGRLYLVADGVTGTASGQVAAQYAIKKVLHNFYTIESPDPSSRLLNVIRQANVDIFERNGAFPERRPMAAALTAALIHNNKLFVANVGDGQVYVVWDQDIERITTESPPPASPSEEKRVNEAETKPVSLPLVPLSPDAPQRKTRPATPITLPPHKPVALGLDRQVEIDTFSRRLFAGDTVVLCSGGFSGYVTDKEIARAVTQHEPEQAIQRLLALAAQRGSRDHLAVSITRVLSSPAAAQNLGSMSLPPAPKWSDWDTTPKPPQIKSDQPASAQTAKLMIPPEPKNEAKPESKTPAPDDETLEERRRWPIFVGAAAIITVILCLTPWLVLRFLVPPDLVAGIPLLGNMVAGEPADDEPVLVEFDQAAGEATATDGPVANAGEASPTATADPATETPASAQVTLVASSDSPLPTPDATFVSPINTPTGSPDQAQPSPTSSPTPAASPTPSPTALPTIEVPANCESKGRFVRDVTVPDGTQFAPAEKFTKVWLLTNAGDCPWGPGYTVRLVDGDRMGVAGEVPLMEITEAGTNGEIKVAMIAPATAGTYRGDWQLFDLAGEPFGPKIYLEIEVTGPDPGDFEQADVTTLYDFVEKAGEAVWSSNETTYTLLESDISETMERPVPEGLAVLGSAPLRGDAPNPGEVLLTYPHQQLGFIEGTYTVDIPLEPTDALAATLGFIKLSILSDDGVTFEVLFTPTGGTEQVILSRQVLYQDSPITEIQPLASIQPGQQGTFTLRVNSGDSLSQDWAVWIDLRLIRPE